MSIQDSIDLFDSKLNQTLWTRQNISPTGKILPTVPSPAILPIENYYKVLEQTFKPVGDGFGTTPAFNTTNYAEYYAHEKTDEVIAVVNSVKYQGTTPTKVAIATYYDHSGEIVILNRFDQTGRPHDNYFHVYSPANAAEVAFYQTYLADRVYTDAQGTTHYQASVPHIHFNTRSQTLAFGHHDKANAISIDSLTRYLADLMNDYNPSSLINRLNMGMPFLDFKNARIDFVPSLKDSIESVIAFYDEHIHISPEKFSDYEKETVDLMKSLINIDTGDGSGGATPPSEGPEDSSGGTTPPPTTPPTTPPTSPSPSRPGGGSGGSAGSGAVASSQQSSLSRNDLRYIATSFPDLGNLEPVDLVEVKNHLTWVLKQVNIIDKLENQQKNHFIVDDLELTREHIRACKAYLKYVKGLLNLKLISQEIELYQDLYEMLNERDPILLSTFSQTLLKSLTTKFKKEKGLSKGGKTNETNQPQR